MVCPPKIPRNPSEPWDKAPSGGVAAAPATALHGVPCGERLFGILAKNIGQISMPSPIDLHLHSNASDGALSPEALVALAHDNRVRCLALTDHDTVAGLAEARRAAQRLGIRFVHGIELSVSWERVDVHVVGLGIDPCNERLLQGISQQARRREERAMLMGERLARKGLHGAWEGAGHLAGEAVVTRTHFARWLVEAGHVADIQSAFKRYLRRGKPGYVPSAWLTLSEAVALITGAGGEPVLAHPLRYPVNRRGLRRLITEFATAGGVGLEAVSSHQTPDRTARLADLCRWHGLLASCGSDFHSPEQEWLAPGRISALPRSVRPIWKDWPAMGGLLDPAA